MNFLADKYRTGSCGLVKSEKKAVKLYKRAVELGEVDAMVTLGSMYSRGDVGVKVDMKKANQLYKMASSGSG